MKKKNDPSRALLARRKAFTRQFYKGNRLMFALDLIQSALMAVFSLLLAWLLQQIMDACTGNSRFTLPQLLLITAGGLGGYVVLSLWARSVHPRFVTRASRQYKDYAFRQITKKSISSFNKENTATYLSALTNDATSIETNYLDKMFVLLTSLVECVGAVVMMLYYSPILTLAGLLLSLLPVLASVLAGSKLAAAEKAVSKQNERFMDMAKDALSGFSVVKSFKAEGEIANLFAGSNGKLEDLKRRRKSTEALIQMFAGVAGVTAQMGVFLLASYLAFTGHNITPGVIIVFVQLMAYVIVPIREVPQIMANRKAACALIDKLAASVEENVRQEGIDIPKALDRAISLQNVSFGYEENPVLKDISFSFDAGKSYAIVGASGSGKSTLLNLLMGGQDSYQGQIRFDSHEIRQVNAESLYELVSLVQQNVFVFNSSILDNITMFRSFPAEELRRAVKMSGLSDLIAQRGWDYSCGENGSALSGGERQRISIARSLLRRSPVLLVDEATAALDPATAFSVTSSILDLTALTRLVVTHRLEEALLQRFDCILVLRNGQISEVGSFRELMEKKAYFYSLFTVSQ